MLIFFFHMEHETPPRAKRRCKKFKKTNGQNGNETNGRPHGHELFYAESSAQNQNIQNMLMIFNVGVTTRASVRVKKRTGVSHSLKRRCSPLPFGNENTLNGTATLFLAPQGKRWDVDASSDGCAFFFRAEKKTHKRRTLRRRIPTQE